MAKSDFSDESLWKLFETSTNDSQSQSVLDKTQLAAEAIINSGPMQSSNSTPDTITPPPPSGLNVNVKAQATLPAHATLSPQTSVPPQTEVDSEDSFAPHILETVLEESSRESLIPARGEVKVGAEDLSEIISPCDTMQTTDPLKKGTTPKALRREPLVIYPAVLGEKARSVSEGKVVNVSPDIQPFMDQHNRLSPPISSNHQPIREEPATLSHAGKEYTGCMPGGLFVTVEKHTLDGVTAAKHITSTPHTARAVPVSRSEPLSSTSPGAVRSVEDTSSSCQSSFDIPKSATEASVACVPTEPHTGRGNTMSQGVTKTASQGVTKTASQGVTKTVSQGRSRAMLSNPQLMGQDVQVKQYDQSARQAAVRLISAKQSAVRTHKNTYTVPVKRVDNSRDLKTGNTSTVSPPQAASINLLQPSQNITVQHELVTSDFVTSLMERLIGQKPPSMTSRDGNSELREIQSLESKLQATEVELNAIKQQMSQQQREDQNKLLAELVHSQRNMQSQLLSLKSSEPSRFGQAGSVSDSLKTPAPRFKLPTATAAEESPAGFMEQVVRNYPSPVSPQKRRMQENVHQSSAPTHTTPRSSPVSSPTRSHSTAGRAARQRRVEEIEQKHADSQLHRLQEKVEKLLDDQRMASIQVEHGLRKEAPIDRYLTDIERISEANQHLPLRNVRPQANYRKEKRHKPDKLDVTFLCEEPETSSLAEQMKKRLSKLQKQKQQTDENMATILSMRAREHVYLYPDDDGCNEELRLHNLVKVNLDRAEADVQKQVAQIDFIPRPLHDVNSAVTRPPAKYRTAAERLKAVQAKVDTGIARKPRVPVDKENEPIDLYRDDAYIRRVYGKALYHAQRRTVERARPDSPTRPIPFKKTTGKTVRSEKSQAGADNSKKGKSSQRKPTNQMAAISQAAPRKNISKSNASTGVSAPIPITPTAVLGSGMRVEHGDHTKMVFDVLPLSQSEIHPSGGHRGPTSGGSSIDARCQGAGTRVSSSHRSGGRPQKMSAVTIQRVESPAFSTSSTEDSRGTGANGASGANVNNNAKSDRDSRDSSKEETNRQLTEDNSETSEWQESVEESTNQPQLMMTADSLELSAVTPVAAEGQRSHVAQGQGQAHSTPIESTDSKQQPHIDTQHTDTQQPQPHVWEEFADDPVQKSSLDEDRSRTDDIVTPPTVLPGYRFRQGDPALPAGVLQTPVTRYKDLFGVGGDRPRQVGGASRYPPEQSNADPVIEQPLYDPTEMATRDWLEQRLMSKCIERMIREYPVRKPEPDVDPTNWRREDDSEHGSLDNTLLAGAMAEGGVAQVYIDAGKPINTEEIRRLMRECLADKIRTMLGTRDMLDRTPGDVTRPHQSGQSHDGITKAAQSDYADEADVNKVAAFSQPIPAERVGTPERTPPSSPVEGITTKVLAQTPEPSPPTTPLLENSFNGGLGKSSDILGPRSMAKQRPVGGDSADGRMPSTPFNLSRQRSRQEEDEVKIQEEAISPSPAAPSAVTVAPDVVEGSKGQGEEKLHLSQVSLWDTLSAAHTQDSVLDDEPPFETRYSIDTPEPTPPRSPPQAVSVQTSFTERGLQAKLAASMAESEDGRRSASLAASYDISRQTPQRPSSTIQPEVIQVAAAQSNDMQATAVQSEGDISTTTVSDTAMNTVSEGEWILKSDGQLTPRGEGTLAELSLASSSDEETFTPAVHVTSRNDRAPAVHVTSRTDSAPAVHVSGEPDEQSHSEGEIYGPTRTDPMVALLSRLKETPKALKSAKAEEGEHVIMISSHRTSAAKGDHTLHMSDLDLEQASNVKVKRQLLSNVENNQSSSSSGGFAFADSKQVTVRSRQLQQALSSLDVPTDDLHTNQPIIETRSPQPTNHLSPTKSAKGSPTKRLMPGMIHSTRDSNRKSRPTSSLRTTGDFSQMSNLASATMSRTWGSVDSPDRMHTEALLRSGGYLTNTYGDTASEISAQRRPETTTLNTQQLLARTIDTQGLSTGVSTAMLDTNRLLADTLDQPQHSMTWRTEVNREAAPYSLNESVDSVSSAGILRSSNDYTRTLSGTPAGNRPRQYLRFSVPTGDDVSSQDSDDISEMDI